MIGTYPCPSTSLALVMMTISLPKVNKILYGLLLFWSLFSLPEILMFSVYEDSILLISGIYGFIMLIKNWRNMKVVSV